jgi:hypothetical protein
MDPRIYLIRQLVGREPFQCTFIKRGDGSVRHMRCITRSPESDDNYRELLAVYDLEVGGDRRVPTDSLLELKFPISPGRPQEASNAMDDYEGRHGIGTGDVAAPWEDVEYITIEPDAGEVLSVRDLQRLKLIKWTSVWSKPFLRPNN